ncbi:MAG: hypothetical protein JWQ26_913 [Modestobacter sp.]|jgi:hypothetical protein|nr:hypothetical protein [Modestobacter sp.]HEV7726979.1 hypothetical protein [Modestobacter sp.]
MTTPKPEHDPATEPASDDAQTQGAEPTGNPVDPALATSSPDPQQTGRDRRED